MPRRPRVNSAGLAYHVLNRAARGLKIFRKPGDYLAFLTVLEHVYHRIPSMRILAFIIMPTHWHLVLWPQLDGELSEFLRLLTVTHTQRHHAHYKTSGTGPLYQGRFKSFPIQEDHHLFTVIRYVERNPLRAGLVQRAQDWPHGSLAKRGRESFSAPAPFLLPPAQWPVPLPSNYLALINRPQTQAELDALHTSIQRGRPFGDDAWTRHTAQRLQLQSSLAPRGRPKKVEPRPQASRGD